MPIRVFIYDDNQARRDSLKNLIELTDSLDYVGEAENCIDAVADMENAQPDVVLMDINMPEVNGLEGLKTIKQFNPNIKVLMQTIFDDTERIFDSIRSGASGYVLKTDSSEKLLQAIHDVQDGGAVMNPGIAAKVLDFFKPVTTTSLSDREKEVLTLLANGLSYKMVSTKLGISFNTVGTYTKRIYEKLHVASLGEAISYYYKHLK